MVAKLTVQQRHDRIRWSTDAQPFDRLIDSGMLYHLNKMAFRPLGFMLTLELNEAGEATGFRMEGNGIEHILHDARTPEAKEMARLATLSSAPRCAKNPARSAS